MPSIGAPSSAYQKMGVSHSSNHKAGVAPSNLTSAGMKTVKLARPEAKKAMAYNPVVQQPAKFEKGI